MGIDWTRTAENEGFLQEWEVELNMCGGWLWLLLGIPNYGIVFVLNRSTTLVSKRFTTRKNGHCRAGSGGG